MKNYRAICQLINATIGAFALIALVVLIAVAQARDDADNRAATAHAQRQARESAQQSTWAKLDRQGCAMVSCERIERRK